MDNTTTTPHGDMVPVTKLELVTCTTAAGTLYGIAFTLFCLYAHLLVLQLRDKDRRRHTKFMLTYSAVIMLCGMYDLVSNAWLAQAAYINHGGDIGGPYTYELTSARTPTVVIMFTCQLVIDALTSAVQIWRLWVVWSATRYAKLIIVLPSLCFLAFITSHTRRVVLNATLPWETVAQMDSQIARAEILIQGATTIFCTVSISLFLAFKHRRQRELIGKAQGAAGYMNVVTMLVESYALESAWLLLVAVISSPAQVFFVETQTYIEIIAYLLVQYRVASEKALYESRRGEGHMSSLHWNRATTQFGETSVGSDSCDLSVKSEASDVILAA